MTYREEVTQRVAPLAAPISDAAPAGVDISYDADFEAIKAEIDKLSSVDNSEPSWTRIQDLAATLLSKKGKDLRVASWMTVAKVKTQGWTGFAESLVLYDALSRTFWDTMYPEAKRPRPRLNAIAWMADMVNQHLVSTDVTFAEGDAVRLCDEVLKELDPLFADKLGDAYVGPGQLRSLLREKIRTIPEPAAAGAPDAGPSPGVQTAPTSVGAAPVAAPVASATSASDVDSAVASNGNAIVQAAAILRAADYARPWSYRLQRWGSWIIIEDVPPAEDGRTFIPGPGESLLQNLNELRDGQKWLELLNTAEALTSDYIFWLDPHRFVAAAMDRLGPQFLAARAVVGREVTQFVARLPNLENLTFSDGMPLADMQTKTWLEEEARKYGGGGGGSAAAAAVSAEDEEIAKRFTEAQTMVAEGKLADGLATALALADRAADARLRFRARLTVGKMALDAAKPELARAMLEHLVSEVERHHLETWEPVTSATLYTLLIAATREVLRAKGGSPELEARQQYLFDKLCRLDPASAIKLST
jgi:type VI secretion system protein VasJ